MEHCPEGERDKVTGVIEVLTRSHGYTEVAVPRRGASMVYLAPPYLVQQLLVGSEGQLADGGPW